MSAKNYAALRLFAIGCLQSNDPQERARIERLYRDAFAAYHYASREGIAS